MHARWLCLTSLSILIACGGESTTDGTGKAAGGSGAQGGSGGSATGGSGVDGDSGTVDGGSGGIEGSLGGAPGGGGSPCQKIIDSYGETMTSAKVCNPFVDVNECAGTAPNSIVCSCAPTHVNPDNAEAIERLKQIQDEAFAQNCLPLSCPAIACEQPVLGTCAPDSGGNSGTCQDSYANDDPGGP